MEVFLREYYPFLIKASAYSFVIPLTLGILLLRKKSSPVFRLLLIYVLLISLIEIAGIFSIVLGTKNNLWLDHLFTPAEFLVLAGVYYVSFKRPVYKYGVAAVSVLFIAFSILNVYLGEDITQMNSLPRVLVSVLLISMAVLYFYQTLQNFEYTYLDRDPVFLLSCGVLIYQAGTSVAYAMFNEALAESYDTARICISIILVLNILFRVNLLLVLKRTPAK